MYKGTDRILRLLIDRSMGVDELAKASSMNEDSVRRILESLKAEGYARLEASESVRGAATEELKGYLKAGFPEAAVYKRALAGASVSDLPKEEKTIGIRWARVKGFVTIESGKLVPLADKADVEAAMGKLAEEAADLEAHAPSKLVMEELFERHLLEKRIVRTSLASYTGKKVDWSLFEEGFDVNVPGKAAALGKYHPVTKMTKRIRAIMTELGFQEMEGDIVESSFWNFDALFQPQDHPARELADTFYV
jgi:phenylalanyl-tRNA synthetase alpha chain